MKNYPKEWLDAISKEDEWICFIHEKEYEKLSTNRINYTWITREEVLNGLDMKGALKEVPEPRTMLFCEKHDGYIYVSSDTDAKMLFCSKHDGHTCILKKYREVL